MSRYKYPFYVEQLLNRIGGPQDPQKSLQLIGAAAQNNFAPAQYTLGMMFLKGEGVDKDQGQAKTWLNKAAEAGHAEAKTALARLSGRTVEDAKNSRLSRSIKQAH